MGRLVRRSLVVDDEKLKELARLRGTSESEAVREAVDEAVDHELVADEVMAAIRELHARGGLRDTLKRVPVRLKRKWRESRSRTRRSSSP